MPGAEAKPRGGRIAVVVKGYPRLSETFIAQEIEGLEQRGFALDIVSLRHPTDEHIHDVHHRIRADVLYLPEYIHDEPKRVLAGLLSQMRRAQFWRLLPVFLRDLARDQTRNRIRRMGQALVLAREMRPETDRVYAHYLHTPGSVGRYTACLRGLPLSLSAHAKDIWTIPPWEISEKLAQARWTVCCTATNTEHLRALCPEGRVELLYHGIGLDEVTTSHELPERDGTSPDQPVRILCVARAVEKKGIDLLLEALAGLPAGIAWSLTHIGGGSLLPSLERQARELGIDERVRWRGPQPRKVVMEAMRQADLFCLPARIASDGDRDGLPNVLLEALANRLAVVTTPVGGIGELVRDGVNGLVVEPDNVAALVSAIERMCSDPRLRRSLGERGRGDVEGSFDARAGLDRLAIMLDENLAG